ncbi:PIF1-like helicase-domain-containing protein [Cantharellus anzutake]|uniref:PIF1-like helicase-domain-containing protein n=1 Tax=Cantharellus anzutake TaxID=1750568 RepID=UPI0019052F51|nr:PIF1-like helicase-domain-containing protein [Cantharellus anzutake]KAF8340711.1 PIF1-like helicase-domain-containing protein [Cantharellus anzutake]
MEDAVASFKSPSQLCFLFMLLILEGAPAIPIWERFADDLARDYGGNVLGPMSVTVKAHTLLDIQQLLQQRGKSTANFGLPNITIHSAKVLTQLDYFLPQCSLLLRKNSEMVAGFSSDQRHVYDTLWNAIYRNTPSSPHLFFLTGRAGRGKTHVSKALIHLARGQGELPFVVGATALAASNYDCAWTAHSGYMIPVVKDNGDVISSLTPHCKQAELIQYAPFLIIDEVGLLNVTVMEAINSSEKIVLDSFFPRMDNLDVVQNFLFPFHILPPPSSPPESYPTAAIPILTSGPGNTPPSTPHATSAPPSLSSPISVRSNTHLRPNTTPLATLLLLLLLLLRSSFTTPPPSRHPPMLPPSAPILTFRPDNSPFCHSFPLTFPLSPPSGTPPPPSCQVTTFHHCPSIALVTSYYVNTIANIPQTFNPASVTSVTSATPKLCGSPLALSPLVMYLSRFPLIPIWTTASSHSSQLVIIPTFPHPPAPLGLALPTSFRTNHRSCLMTFGTALLLLPFVPVWTSSS